MNEEYKKETKYRLALKHNDGLYLSWSVNNFPLTPKISEARRFYNIDELNHFMAEAVYKPDNPEDYEIVEIQIDYKERETDV